MPEPVKQPLVFEPASSTAMQRLIREVEGSGRLSATAYNRTYNRHNR
jgi:hypothetical protein